MSMVRPRGGDFVYDANERAAMLRDIEILRGLGTDGVVFGCLTHDGRLDEETTAKLIAAAVGNAAAGMDITFHMAFDVLKADEQFATIDWLATHGVTRILTHGSADGSSPILGNVKRLAQYVKAAAGRLIILPGGGVTKNNVAEVCAALGVNEAHGTRIV
jgi:copper homeostasis protein